MLGVQDIKHATNSIKNTKTGVRNWTPLVIFGEPGDKSISPILLGVNPTSGTGFFLFQNIHVAIPILRRGQVLPV